MVPPYCSPMVFDSETKLQRKRRRHLGGGGRNSSTTTCHSIKDCFCPCNHVIGCTFTALVCLWVWLLHRAISHDPHHHHPSSSSSFNNNNGALTNDSLFPGTLYIPPVLPQPMFPPDMKNHPHQADNGAFSSSSSSSKPRPLMLTWQSNQHAFNQDRAMYYPTFANRQQQNHALSDNDTFLVALFDGHGRDGHLMAEFVTRHFADAFAAKLNAQPPGQSDEWIAAQLNATFFEMEALAQAHEFAYTGGCTASVTMRLGNKLYFANAGDSRTMLASNFEATHEDDETDPFAANVWYSTRLDKANLPDERARIQALGGKIHDPPPEKEFQPSRVVVTSQYLHDTVALAMSRSLGDVEWTAVGVTPEPIVDVIRLDDNKHRRPYLIVASDGMWDCRARRPQFFAKQLGNILFESSAEHDAVTQTTKLVDFLKEITPQKPEWYRDDITVIAFAL